MTPYWEIQIDRRLYQPDQGGRGYVPLDEKWAMRGQYATIEVRESILYSVALRPSSANQPEQQAIDYQKWLQLLLHEQHSVHRLYRSVLQTDNIVLFGKVFNKLILGR